MGFTNLPLKTEPKLSKEVDFTTGGTYYYIGEAPVGTPRSSPFWRIKRGIIQSDDDTSETWADGDQNFDNVWDDRLTLTYTG